MTNQIWSTSGANDRSDLNSTFLQPFANYNVGGGLSMATIEATAKWEADETWTAPRVLLGRVATGLARRRLSCRMLTTQHRDRSGFDAAHDLGRDIGTVGHVAEEVA